MAGVLIVEDEPKLLRLLELSLSEEGFTVSFRTFCRRWALNLSHMRWTW